MQEKNYKTRIKRRKLDFCFGATERKKTKNTKTDLIQKVLVTEELKKRVGFGCFLIFFRCNKF
jgi:hypothetical protein